MRDISRHSGNDLKTIIKLFRKYNIPRRSGLEAWLVRRISKTLPRISRDVLQREYISNRLNSYDIAEKYNLPARTIRRYLRRYGIGVRQKCPKVDTSIELLVQDELEAREIGHYKQYAIKNLCRIDKAFPDEKIAVFCDGKYWHSFPNVIAKDARIDSVLSAAGWVVLRFSEDEIKRDVKAVVNKIEGELKRRKNYGCASAQVEEECISSLKREEPPTQATCENSRVSLREFHELEVD